jgi:hypothetical protein
LLCAGLALAQQPAAPLVHFHHLHFNPTDPAAALDFYTTPFNGEKRTGWAWARQAAGIMPMSTGPITR